MSIHVHLERFEGPLGLLLHLIREQEMDIFNININEITRQYLEYIKAMRRLDLEVAGEFVAMAATLLQIKSRMLLPSYNEDGEEIATEDPRKELIQKLVEYKKIKELSGELYKRSLLGRDVFARGERLHVQSDQEGELVLDENPLYSLIAAYRLTIKNMTKTVHRVAGSLQSIASRILEIRERLVIGQRVLFRDLITVSENLSGQVLVTFLSVLELAKMGMISVFQNEPFADIHIETKQQIDGDVVSKVENYDSINSETMADSILAKAQLSLDEAAGLDDDDADPSQEPQAALEIVEDSATDEDIEAEERRLFVDDSVSDGREAQNFAMDESPAPSEAATEMAVVEEEVGHEPQP
jgi:segregation and condensation protein A